MVGQRAERFRQVFFERGEIDIGIEETGNTLQSVRRGAEESLQLAPVSALQAS
jgi:hypothetical protein